MKPTLVYSVQQYHHRHATSSMEMPLADELCLDATMAPNSLPISFTTIPVYRDLYKLNRKSGNVSRVLIEQVSMTTWGFNALMVGSRGCDRNLLVSPLDHIKSRSGFNPGPVARLDCGLVSPASAIGTSPILTLIVGLRIRSSNPSQKPAPKMQTGYLNLGGVPA